MGMGSALRKGWELAPLYRIGEEGSRALPGAGATPTHGGREDDDAQHIHAIAGARFRLVNDLRWWGQVQGKVLHMRAILFLDPIDKDSSRRGLFWDHSGGLDNWSGLGAVLLGNTPTRKES
jgi:hypothetical protein